MYSNIELQQKVIENWLGNYYSVDNPWKLCNTLKNNGRGLIATRDIKVNELILCEPPLIIGPVGDDKDHIICVACFKLISSIEVCSNCRLPLCSNCAQIEKHFLEECHFVRSLKEPGNNDRQRKLLKALTSIRGLFLSDCKKNVIKLLQANRTSDTEKVIDDVLDGNASIRDDLIEVASVLNTNCFQVVADLSCNQRINLRGLYPIMSLINHCCTANARYSTDVNYITSLFARKEIKMGEEISISYAKLLRSTPSRQSYPKITKQFTCTCDLCMDPTESSTYLSALKCLDRTCPGVTLPLQQSIAESFANFESIYY